MKDFIKKTYIQMRDSNLNRTGGRLFTALVLLFTLAIGNAWAGGGGGNTTYKTDFKATGGATGKGYVYASEKNSDTPAYVTTSDDISESGDKGENGTSTYYAWAKAVRGHEFNGWTLSNTTKTTDNSGVADVFSVTAGSSTVTGVVTATWTDYTSVNVTYNPSEDGVYSVTYQYNSYNSSSKTITAGDAENLSRNITSENGAQTIGSYYNDVITLQSVSGDFQGWYSDAGFNTLLSTANPYTYVAPQSGTGSVYAKYPHTDKYYGRLTASVAEVPYSMPAGGMIFISTEASAAPVYSENAQTVDNVGMGSTSLTYYLKAQPTDKRYVFRGWYSNAQCTGTPLSTNKEYTYSFTASSTNSASPTTGNIYAAFAFNLYYMQVEATTGTSSAGLGMVLVRDNNTGTPEYGEYSSSSEQFLYAYRGAPTANAYLYAKPKYGYKFSGWYDNPECTGTAIGTSNPQTYAATGTSTDPLNPTIVPVYAKFIPAADGDKISITYNIPDQTKGEYTASVLDIEEVDDEYVWIFTEVYNSADYTANKTISQYKTDVLRLESAPKAGYGVTSWSIAGTTKTTPSQLYETSATTTGKAYGVAFGEARPFLVSASASDKTGTAYSTLREALDNIGSNKKITVVQNAYVPAGNYEIPSGVTLLVPYNADYAIGTNQPTKSNGTTAPTPYCMLTIASGAHINVKGAISVNAIIRDQQNSNTAPTGTCGMITMESGSQIELQSGANLYVWGCILGTGDITAHSGSTVYEAFQANDYPGGTFLLSNLSKCTSRKIFPIRIYCVPNIQAFLHIEYGAQEKLSVSFASMSAEHNIGFIGSSSGMFRMASGTTVTKWYDKANDRQRYSVAGDAELASISMKVQSIYDVNSQDFVLPITHNMQIDFLSGTTTIDYDIELLPGAKVTIAAGATANIKSGASAYVYDVDDWKQNHTFANGANKSVIYGRTTTMSYAKDKLPDAILEVNGQLNVNGALYTTVSGGDIISTGSGQIQVNAIGTATTINQVVQSGSSVSAWETVSVTPAKLHNGDDSYVFTKDATAGDKFIYDKLAEKWLTNPKTITWNANGGTVEDAISVHSAGAFLGELPAAYKEGHTFAGWWTAASGGEQISQTTKVTANVTYYAHWTPKTYTITYMDEGKLPFSGTHVDSPNAHPTTHTYGTATTLNGATKTGDTFLGWYTISNCKESSKVTSLSGEAFAKDITLYAKWSIKVLTISASPSEYGSVSAASLNVPLDSEVATSENTFTVNGTTVTATPTTATAQYTYAFDHWDNLPATVTKNAAIKAVFTRTTNKYTITWKNADGTTLKTEQVEYGTTPSYTGTTPTKAATSSYVYTHSGWTPTVSAVTGNATYTATYSQAATVASVTAGSTTTYYSTLPAAFTAANGKAECTIKLLKSVDVQSATNSSPLAYTAAGICTLDLNNYTITGTTGGANLQTGNPRMVQINNSAATFIVTDNSSAKGGKIKMVRSGARGRYFAIQVSAGTLVINSGTVSAENQTTWNKAEDDGQTFASDAIWLGEGTTLQVTGGTIEAKSFLSARAIDVTAAATVTISGGTLTATTTSTASNSSSCTQSKEAITVYTTAGTTTISGGKFLTTSTNTNATLAAVNNAVTAANMPITGGYYSHNTNLATYVSAPYRVLATTAADKSTIGNDYNYKVNNNYTVTWNATTNGGTCETATTGVTYNQSIGTLPAATKAHYTLDGWFTAASDGTQITEATQVTADVTYYAQFTINKHNLTWDMDGGQTSSTAHTAAGSVAYGTGITYPAANTMTKENYVFNGWSTNASTMPDEDLTITAQWTPAVASVTVDGTTYYKTVSEAFTAANEKTNATVTMLQNATTTSQIELTKTMTIDLNGKTVSSTLASATGVFKINASGKTVTITDSGTGGKIDHTASYSGSDYMYGLNLVAGTLNIDGGTIYAKNTANNRAYGIYNTGSTTLNVSGGTIEATSSNSPFGLYDNSSCALTMTGGTFTASGPNSRGIYTRGTTRLTDATITASGESCYTIFAKAGTMTINSGTYTATGSGAGYAIYFEAGTVTVNGGKFKGIAADIAKRNTAYNVILKGGYYVHNTDLAAKCATGYQVKTLPDTHEEYANGYRYMVDNVYAITLNTNGGTINAGNVESYTYGMGATLPTDVTRAGFDFNGWYKNSECTGDTVMTISNTATGDKEFWAKWTASAYTITWLNYNGEPLGEQTITTRIYYGEYPTYDWHNSSHPTPTREATNGRTYAWDGWTTEPYGDGDFYLNEAMPVASGNATYYAHYKITSIVITESNDTITENADVITTTVRVSGKLNVTSGATLTTNDLILEGTPSSSGEIIGDVDATQHAYFDFSQPGGFEARRWYAVAVPWQVDVPWNAGYSKTCGISAKTGEGEFTPLALGRQIDLIYYNGTKRAAEGHSDACWQYVEDDGQNEVMMPGKAYMFYLLNDADVLRFERKAGTDLLTNTLAVETYGQGTGNIKDANWNGIANPALYHAYINPAADKYEETENAGQVYDADTKSYSVVNLSSTSLTVGKPVFVQATESNPSVVAYVSHNEAYHAPRRAQAYGKALTRYEVMFAASDEEVTDRIIVRMDENKEKDVYTVGQDLVKMDVSPFVPQMWIERYNSKMCINTVAPTGDAAYYPLSLFAPKDGEYDLFIESQPDNSTMLYLTYDGETIWNLSYGGYVATLEKGDNSHYGLRIISKAPQVATGMDEAVADAQGETRKVIINDKVYIIRNNRVYSADGQLVK